MFNGKLSQIVVLVSLIGNFAYAELPSAVNKVFDDLNADFKKTPLQLVVDKSAKSGIVKADVSSVLAIQTFSITEKVVTLKKMAREAIDDSLTPKQRFAINQTKNSLDFVKSHFTIDACTPIKIDGYTRFEKTILAEFEPTAIASRKIESEVIVRLFEMVNQMCAQVVKKTDI